MLIISKKPFSLLDVIVTAKFEQILWHLVLAWFVSQEILSFCCGIPACHHSANRKKHSWHMPAKSRCSN